MAINKRFPHVYDAEYVGSNGLREVNLFRRSASATINYFDASGAPVSRQKGFEDTNLTEDGRVNETGLILQTVGINIKAGPMQPNQDEGYDEFYFFERGYAELVLNDNQVVFTARIKDLPFATNAVASGSLQFKSPDPNYFNGAMTVNNIGRPYPANGIRIPRGVRFALNLRWDRPLILPSLKTCRIEAEMWAVSDELDPAEARVLVPSPVLATGLPVVR